MPRDSWSTHVEGVYWWLSQVRLGDITLLRNYVGGSYMRPMHSDLCLVEALLEQS